VNPFDYRINSLAVGHEVLDQERIFFAPHQAAPSALQFPRQSVIGDLLGTLSPRHAAVRQKRRVEEDEEGRGKVAVHRRQVRRQRPARHVSTKRPHNIIMFSVMYIIRVCL